MQREYKSLFIKANFDWINDTHIQKVLSKLKTVKWYFVGGCVRDSLIGEVTYDIDITTEANPDTIEQLMQDFTIATIGKRFGTIGVFIGKWKIEITTTRHDVQTFGRHADVEFTASFYEDSCRRDFTINALLYDGNEIIDYHHGITDLINRRVVFIGNAIERIQEDYLRIIRYIRFFYRFSNLPYIEYKTEIANSLNGLSHVSKERFLAEISSICKRSTRCDAIDCLNEYGLSKSMFDTQLSVEGLNLIYEYGFNEDDYVYATLFAKANNTDQLPLSRRTKRIIGWLQGKIKYNYIILQAAYIYNVSPQLALYFCLMRCRSLYALLSEAQFAKINLLPFDEKIRGTVKDLYIGVKIAMLSENWMSKLRRIPYNIYAMGLGGALIQIGATLVYTTAEVFATGLMDLKQLLLLRTLSESIPTIMRPISGYLSDRFENRKLILVISYGSMIILKLIFLTCIFIAKELNPTSRVLLYASYTYATTHVIDRIMSCLRDAPQTALLLESIAESNRVYISNGEHEIAHENTLISLSMRKLIASIGSVVGGIAAYAIVKLKLLSASGTYALALLPIVIGNIVIYLGVQEVYKKYQADEVITVSESTDMTTSIVKWCYSHVNMIEAIYLMVAGILSMVFHSSITSVSIFVILHKLLFMKNDWIAVAFRIALLFGLVAGYGIGMVIAFATGVYLSSGLSSFMESINIGNLLFVLMSSNNLYSIVFHLFCLLLMPVNCAYLALMLIAAQYLISIYDNVFSDFFITGTLLVLSQLRVLYITSSLIAYALFVIVSTISVYGSTGVYMLVLPARLMSLVQFCMMVLMPYKWLFCLSFILQVVGMSLKNQWSYLLVTALSYLTTIQTSLINRLIITSHGFTAIRSIFNNRIITGVMTAITIIVSIITMLATGITLQYRIVLVCIATVSVLSILYYMMTTDLIQKCLSYDLKPFLYTVAMLCIVYMGRCNDAIFFKHGYNSPNLQSYISCEEIPLMFTLLYIVISIGAITLPYLKKNRSLLFVFILSCLILTNLFLLWHSLIGFIIVLIFLGLFTSGTEILFVSMIKELIPSTDVSATFLGVYYLGTSLATIINAVLSIQLTRTENIPTVISIFKFSPIIHKYLSQNHAMVYAIFCIFPIISMIMWFNRPKNNSEIKSN